MLFLSETRWVLYCVVAFTSLECTWFERVGLYNATVNSFGWDMNVPRIACTRMDTPLHVLTRVVGGVRPITSV